MSDEVLRSKVKDLLEKMERVFHKEWRKTKLNMDHEMVEHFVDPKGTFLQPDGVNTNIPWPSRDELLICYRSLLEEFAGELSEGVTAPEVTKEKSYADIVSGEDSLNDSLIASTAESLKGDVAIPKPIQQGIPAPITSSHAIPKPKTGTEGIPGPGNIQWPGPMTAPIGVTAAAGTPQVPKSGFHNPFAAAAAKPDTPKAPAPMEGPSGGVSLKHDPAALRAIDCQKKFAYLLEGVKQETIRDFILAEGTNSNTGKPTIIIYTLEQIWLEFAFPYEEGQRILNKYPQRDPELIEFMKASGHNE
ncbi:hypothetical protein ACFPK9_15065 [Rubritalea spongiae]|uniref:Uncharacterized protein n=1 Tax=Rubritalea spongiae TaxID=430797 RepID=A0ABW5DXC9_9BACT